MFEIFLILSSDLILFCDALPAIYLAISINYEPAHWRALNKCKRQKDRKTEISWPVLFSAEHIILILSHSILICFSFTIYF